MATLKCKMCGGDLTIEENQTVCECEYCGSTQTIPIVDDEKKMTLFNRANRLRFSNEFDKASGIYESIVADFPEEAEAYWGLVLCKYGIEYVDDPGTGKKIPTCHRSSFDSVMKDDNFEQVMELSDTLARIVYRDEAKAIEELRKSIIEISVKEEPYDIFICYKETDENGKRTVDSAIAQDVYDALTDKGYRVFFSRISLEDKLGQEYEPYIFAALNSAKIMLAFGTSYDYYNAVWVKNEWSRFLKIMAKDKGKYLIPCYKNIDVYDMPEEFSKLQAQDMGKVGAISDLLRGIEKLIGKKIDETTQQSKVLSQKPKHSKQKIIYGMSGFVLVCFLTYILVMNVIIPNYMYNQAIDHMNANEFVEAIAIFNSLNGFRDSNDQVRVCNESMIEFNYITAKDLMDNGEYEKACSMLNDLDGYKDSDELLNRIALKSLSDVSVGDTIEFGDYKGNTEWEVLDKKAGKIFVISKYAVEKHSYNSVYTDVTWESCKLRKWLNETYITSAFNSDEQALILSTNIENTDNKKYGIDGGINTTDKIFLLSIDEAKKYLTSDSERQTTLSDGTSVWWWLRSPGFISSYAANVQSDGTIDGNGVFGEFVQNGYGAVRPAMWIDISNL